MKDGRTDGQTIAYTCYSIYAVARKNQLKSRVEGLYASFHVSLRVNATQLSRAVTVMMNEEAGLVASS